MKKYFYLYCLGILFIWGCSKNKNNAEPTATVDSLAIYLSKTADKKIDPKQQMTYANKAFLILSNQNNNLATREQLKQLAVNYYGLNNNPKFKTTSDLLLLKSVESKDSINIGIAYKNLGRSHLDSGQTDSAFYYCIKAEKIALQINDSLLLGDIYLDKAFVQLYEGDFSGCEISASKALGYLNKSENKYNVYDAFNLIGVSSNELKNYDRALEYHNKAYNYLVNNKLKNNNNLEAVSLNNIGYVYQNTTRHKEAISAFNKALKDKELKANNPSMYAMLIDNLAYSKFKIKDYNQLPDLFFESLKIRDSLKINFSGIVLNKIHLSEFFAAREDTLQAQFYAKDALADSRKTNSTSDILVSLKQLAIVEHQNAAKYSKEYIKLNDSLQVEERKNKDKFARIAYETDEIIQEKGALEEQNRTLFYLFIVVFSLGVLLFVIRAQRSKNRELVLKQLQQKANEDIYNLIISQQNTIELNRVKEKKRIAQELHDGVLGRLFGARLNLDSLNKFNDEASAQLRLNYLEELKSIEQDIREISHDLSREKSNLVNNFVAIVNKLIVEQKNAFATKVEINMDEDIKWDKVTNSTKINLYRILQESLQNINKYAQAGHAKIEFKKDIDNIVLKIVDDGIGFQVNGKKKGIGLQNMISRSKDCGGEFEIISNKGEGTKIVVSVPQTLKITA